MPEVIEESTEKVENTESSEYESLDEGQKELAIKHGFLKKEEEDGEHEEQPNTETEENTDEQKEEESEEKILEFEDVEQDESKLKTFNKNEKALYFRWKSDKKKRQDAVDKYKKLEAEMELGGVKAKIAEQKITRIKELLADETKELTVKDLMSIIEADLEESNEKLTESEWKKKTETEDKVTTHTQEQFKERQESIQLAGNELVDNFDKIAILANEVVSQDEIYQEVLGKAFLDPEVNEVDVVKKIVSVAKLNPKYKELESGTLEEPEIESSEKAKKVLKNAGKKASSASVGSGAGKVADTEENLTIAQAAKLSTKEWMKLKKETRKRILMSIDPE